MSYCKVCSTSRDVTQEQRLDGRHSYAGSAGDTFKGFSEAVRRAAMEKNVRGVTASQKINLFVTNGRRKNNEQGVDI